MFLKAESELTKYIERCKIKLALLVLAIRCGFTNYTEDIVTGERVNEIYRKMQA